MNAIRGLLAHHKTGRGFHQGQVVSASVDDAVQDAARNTVKLLSFNIQVGINTQQYRHYLTRSWQHILPTSARVTNLDQIARLISPYDIVAIQEADGGSLRSGFINQIEYLAHRARFPFWYQQLNRNLGRIAQHSNGLLTRQEPLDLEDHKLPGLLPGRGAIVTRLGSVDNPLLVVMMHLALSQRTRNNQLAYIRDLIEGCEHVILMGDMNTHAEQLMGHSPLKGSDLRPALWNDNTFPSWRPRKSLDHIFLSSSLAVRDYGVVDFALSDHLPVSVEIELPEGFYLTTPV
ncbi:endonuclease/exonuclease/phosphatase family protein [Kistimonas scapharcae]|uniref:Endonuclease/exonuclease/phosphatase family protein n=1 Tax=Kistimonas scapharcae TaxID=1036133 RepID=A0ABP8V7R1_9GAMM